MQYLEKETFFLDEIFRIFYGLVHLSMGKISGQNSEIWFFGIYQNWVKNPGDFCPASYGKAKKNCKFQGL